MVRYVVDFFFVLSFVTEGEAHFITLKVSLAKLLSLDKNVIADISIDIHATRIG